MIIDYSTSIGDRIRFLRLSHNLTQDELAANLGITGRRVSDYEKGVITPDRKLIETLSSFFKCEASYFTTDGCLREEHCCGKGDFMLDICEGCANEKGEFKSAEYIMTDRGLCLGRKTFVWRVNNEFATEYGIEEGTNYLVSLTAALLQGDKILVVSEGKTFIARYEYIDGKGFVTECKENSKRRVLKKSDVVCGRIRGIIKFE